ncbi:MAG: class I SAM-dependent DNA methyltransferase, partial [Proteobacteria bacterium]|nr:class I SAM-dependent DNA methyltransferase [Pseudomonadota bacterium]
RPLATIECRDAVLNEDGTRAEWPEADVVVGNPPFLGGKRFMSVLGDEYTKRLRAAYEGAVEPFADFAPHSLWASQGTVAADAAA